MVTIAAPTEAPTTPLWLLLAHNNRRAKAHGPDPRVPAVLPGHAPHGALCPPVPRLCARIRHSLCTNHGPVCCQREPTSDAARAFTVDPIVSPMGCSACWHPPGGPDGHACYPWTSRSPLLRSPWVVPQASWRPLRHIRVGPRARSWSCQSSATRHAPTPPPLPCSPGGLADSVWRPSPYCPQGAPRSRWSNRCRDPERFAMRCSAFLWRGVTATPPPLGHTCTRPCTAAGRYTTPAPDGGLAWG